jgi:predicted dehydrogenase
MIISCMIIGLGKIGLDYDFEFYEPTKIYSHAHAISAHPGFRLVGAVDLSPNQRKRFEQRYALPTFDDVEVALEKIEPDLVVISSSSETHFSVFNKVLDNFTPKLILCEKPLTNKLSEAQLMVDKCNERGISLFVNYFRRADPGVLEIKKRIDSAQIEAPIKANIWYSKGLLNNGSHFLDLIAFWLGDISHIKVINPGRLWYDFDTEPDFAVHLKKGEAIFRSAWEEKFSHYGIELLSGSGRLKYDLGGSKIEWESVRVDPDFSGYKILSDNCELIKSNLGIYQFNVYEQLFNHTKGCNTSLSTGQEALDSLKIIDLINQQRKLL